MSPDTPPPFRYRQPLMHDVEDVERYCPGGYHPVDIGDVLCSGERAYEIVHKLGHGGFSTVWLVRSPAQKPLYFALKILSADVVHVPELNFFHHLRNVAASGHPNLMDLQDSFKVVGPNGEHHCLVFPVLGPSLQNSKAAKALSPITRHRVCQQIAAAVAFLHQHQICHGDLTASNVLFELPEEQTLTTSYIPQLLGQVKAENLQVIRSSPLHAPKRVIQSPALSGLDFSLLTRVRIIDFVQAFFTHNPPRSLGTPIEFFPPEICFSYMPSPASDVWQLACLFYQTHSTVFLFPVFFRIFEMIVGQAVDFLGPLPQQWKGKFDFAEYGYREPGKTPNTTDSEWWFEAKQSETTIEGRLTREATHLSIHQREGYARLLHDMTAFEPEKRLSATEVMRRGKDLLEVDN